MKPAVILFSSFLLMMLSSFVPKIIHDNSTVSDVDGNIYHTVIIGSQVWMAENLKVSRYRNGDTIRFVINNEEWENLASGAWCYYNNNPETGRLYGGLYNWYAITDPRGLCPEGWHVPTDEEFDRLAHFLGGDLIAGGKLKPDGDAGFVALAAGYRLFTGKFKYRYEYAGFWSSSEANKVFAWPRFLNYNEEKKLHRLFYGKNNALSCRCLKD